MSASKVLLNYIEGLLTSCGDRTSEVQTAAAASVVKLCGADGRHVETVLQETVQYLESRSNIGKPHQINLLEIITKCIQEDSNKALTHLTAEKIAISCTYQLTQSKDVLPDLQGAASEALVALSGPHFGVTWEKLESKIVAGELPHYFVLQTLGNIAKKYPTEAGVKIQKVLGTMLPLLGMVRHDNMKYIFAWTISNFCQAAIEYGNSTGSSLKEALASEVYSALDVLFTVWFASKEQKVQISVLEATGKSAYLIEKTRLEELIPKIVQATLTALKKTKEPLPLLRVVTSILEASIKQDIIALDAHFDQIWGTIFGYALGTNEDDENSGKIFREIAHAMSIINGKYSHKQLTLLLGKLENKDEKTRGAALAIIKFLVNKDEETMTAEDKQSLIISGVRSILNDNNNHIKKLIAQTVEALATKGFLKVEGGMSLVEFLAIQSGLDVEEKLKDPRKVTNAHVAQVSQQVLQKVYTEIEDLEEILWPNSLAFITSEKCTTSLPYVANSLHLFLEENGSNTEMFDIDFEQSVNLPKPQAIFARLLVQAGFPNLVENRGLNVLNLLHRLAPIIHSDVQTLFDSVIPKLVKYINDKSGDSWNQKSWEDLVLKLLSKTLDHIADEEWASLLSHDLSQQLRTFYSGGKQNEDKYFMYKCMGIVMRQTESKKVVDDLVATIFSTVDHSDQQQREGCALALGFAAASHLDQALEKLDMVLKGKPMSAPAVAAPAEPVEGKKKRFGGFGKSSSSGGSETKPGKPIDDKGKATVMLCYGYVCLYAPINLITSRLEANVLAAIVPFFTTVKDVSLKQNIIRCTQLVARSVHPDHLKQAYLFNKRNEILKYLQNYVDSEPNTSVSSNTRSLALDALASLIQLEPVLSEADILELVTASCKSVIALPKDGSVHGKKTAIPEAQAETLALLETTLESFNKMVIELTHRCVTFGDVYHLYSHLERYILSTNEWEQERTLHALKCILKTFLERETGSKDSELKGIGHLLGKLLPIANDTSADNRKKSLECIELVYAISVKMGNSSESSSEKVRKVFDKIRSPIGDSENAFSSLNDLAKVVSYMIPTEEIQEYTLSLFGGLSDPHANYGAAVCIAFNNVFKHRCEEFKPHIVDLVVEFGKGMEFVASNEKTKQGLLRAFRVFGTYHLQQVVQELVSKQSLPYSSQAVELWEALASTSKTVSQQIIEYFVEVLTTKQPFEEKGEGSGKTASRLIVAVSMACSIVFEIEETKEVVKESFCKIFVALITNIGSFLETEQIKPVASQQKPPPKSKKNKEQVPVKEDVSGQITSAIDPKEVAAKAMESFLRCTEAGILNEDEEGIWEKLKNKEEIYEGVKKIAKLMCDRHSGDLKSIIPLTSNVLNSVYDSQRTVIGAFYGQLIYEGCGNADMALVEQLMNSLLSKLVDTCYMMRKLAIQGAANVHNVTAEEVQKFSTPVLSALVSGLEDRESPDDEITLVSIDGLEKVLERIDEPAVRGILVTICLRIKQCYEKDRPEVRKAAFRLFGSLSKFASGPSESPFLEQVHSILINILLHINDADEEVGAACKQTLLKVSKLLDSKKVVEACGQLDAEEFDYTKFLNEISRAFIAELTDKVNLLVMSNLMFFKSPDAKIRRNSVLLVGFLVGNLPEKLMSLITIDHISSSMIQLLKDSDNDVRIAAAQAMGELSNLN